MEPALFYGICAVLFAVQLLLCFNAKRIVLRLLPVLLLSAVTLLWLILYSVTSNWEPLGYAMLAMLSGMLLIPCAVGWGIWAVIWVWNTVKKKTDRKF